MMGRIWAATVAVAVVVFFGCVHSTELPPEIKIDRYLLAAEKSLKAGDSTTALALLDEARRLLVANNIDVPDTFWLTHAEASLDLGAYREAEESVMKYLQATGRGGEHYRMALELLDSAEHGMRVAEQEWRLSEIEREVVADQQRRNDRQAQRQIESASVQLPSDPLSGGGLAPTMVQIAAGQFQFWPRWGSRLHHVAFDEPFAVSAHEVTRGEYTRFVMSTGYKTEAERSPSYGCDNNALERQRRTEATWKRPGFPQTDDHPVVCVSVGDAIAYTDWLSRETGRTYRLPSATEWQYAARAGSTASMLFVEPESRYEYGTDACSRGNIPDSSYGGEFAEQCDDGWTWTAPVGRYVSNGIGIYDLIGNVSEMVLNCYNYDGTSEVLVVETTPGTCPADRRSGTRGLGAAVIARGSSWQAAGAWHDNYGGERLILVKAYREADWYDGKLIGHNYLRNSAFDVGFRVLKEVR